MKKTCAKCNKEKPASEFYKRAQLLDGLSSYCKDCWKEIFEERKDSMYKQQAEYRKKNAVQRRKKHKEYWKEHGEEIRARRRAKYRAEKEGAAKAAPKTKRKPTK